MCVKLMLLEEWRGWVSCPCGSLLALSMPQLFPQVPALLRPVEAVLTTQRFTLQVPVLAL